MFPQKTEESSGGNRPKSSIELEMQKVTKKSTALPQSRRPLMKAVDCLKESLGASKVDDSFPMPPTITQDWVPSGAEIKKLVKLRYYQAHNEYIPTNTASVLDPDAVRMGMSLSGSYPVKVSTIKDLETQSRDIIRVLSHTETFSFAVFKSLQSENMDSKVLLEILKSMSGAITDAMSIATAQTLGLQQLRREAAIQSAPKALSLQRQRESFVFHLSPQNFYLTDRLVPYTKRIWLKTRRPLLGTLFPIRLNLIRRLLLPLPDGVSLMDLVRKRLNLRRPQRRTSPSLLLDPLEKDLPFGVLTPEVQVVAPPVEEPPPLENTEVLTPLPLPLPNIPVGGRLAHFAQNWAKITDDKWVHSLVRKGYRIPFQKRPILSPDPVFF